MTHELLTANVQIYEHEGEPGVWVLITGEMFGPFTDLDQAIDALPTILRALP